MATARRPRGRDDLTPSAEVRALLIEVHERLCRAYNCPIAYFHALDPLDELVSSLLSHRTKNADSARAYRNLRAAFPDWEAVRDAPVAEVERALSPCTWPEAKAPALQRTLREITARQGRLTLDHLAGMSVVEARAWLEELTGVGPKTSAAVLSFSSLRRRALPVDSHHHRVAIRLGLIPANLAVGPSHRVLEAMLPEEWDAQQVYDDHEILMLHGQRVCHFQNPQCGRCVLLDLCPTGKTREMGRTKPVPAI
ncbi:endonuclease III domain-containing protein [Roseomonas elaeocarpi]|uniref:Endonuclease III domain-containing protein n=1 Tax=Roseomonas elaeocarpi TaxID=907779 RepID=A0ABV6JQ31_9PROT